MHLQYNFLGDHKFTARTRDMNQNITKIQNHFGVQRKNSSVTFNIRMLQHLKVYSNAFAHSQQLIINPLLFLLYVNGIWHFDTW